VFRLALSVAVAAAVLAFAGSASGAERPGFLDQRIAYSLGEKINAVGTVPGSRILVAGGSQAFPGVHSRIRAYLPDGAPDTGFGGDGRVDLDPDTREVVAMKVEPDSQILLGLRGPPDALMRLNADGTPDTTFGTGGTREIGLDSAGGATLNDLVLQPDGRMLVVAAPLGEVPPEKFLHLKRFLPDGSPDPALGTGGEVDLSTGNPLALDAKLSLQPDGRIVVAVRSYRDLPVKVARLSANGQLDSSFGRGGLAEVEFGEPARAARARTDARSDWHPITLPDGRIRIPVMFDVARERPYRMALVGLTRDGHPDLRFGWRGLALGPHPELPGGESPGMVVRDRRGGLVVAGSLWSGAEFSGDDAGLVRRFRRDGTPDRSFGPRGFARGAVPGGGYSVIEQRLAFLDGDTLVAAEHDYDGKYGTWGAAAVRTLHAGYDRGAPAISLVAGCRSLRVRISDLSALDRLVVRANGRVIRRTSRKRFRARLPEGTRRLSVRATDLAGNSSIRSVRLPRCQ
jgi:uncharacterized delta-60 repeat protein